MRFVYPAQPWALSLQRDPETTLHCVLCVFLIGTIFAAIDLKVRKNADPLGHVYGFSQVSAAAPVKRIAFAG